MDKRIEVLIVDDDQGARETISDILFLKGYNTFVACNGKEALEIIKSRDIDLVILDVVLPKVNGYQLYHTLQKNKDTQNLPVIMISGKQSLPKMLFKTHKEASCYLVKGIDPEELLKAVDLAISGRIHKKGK